MNCIQVQDTSASPTLSRLLTAGLNKGGSLKSDRSTENSSGVDNLCQEMNDLMHDYEVVSRISDLTSTLRGNYKVNKHLCIIFLRLIKVIKLTNMYYFYISFSFDCYILFSSYFKPQIDLLLLFVFIQSF